MDTRRAMLVATECYNVFLFYFPSNKTIHMKCQAFLHKIKKIWSVKVVIIT